MWIAGQQYPLGERSGRPQVHGSPLGHVCTLDFDAPMAEPRDISEALREAVERTVQATVETGGRAQGAVDDLAGSVDDIVRGAEKGISARRRSVRAAVEDRLPATQEDVRELRTELRTIARRLEAIENSLAGEPPKRTSRAGRGAAKPRGKGRTGSKGGTAAKPKRGGGSNS